MKAKHNFHSMEYVADWANKVGNPVRQSVFHHILAHLSLLESDAPHVVELASGPGLLARFLFENLPAMTYEGLDFSAPMIALAEERIARFADRVVLHEVDLRDDDWPGVVARAPDAIISTQALHDVGGLPEHERVYRAASALLAPGALFLNADFVRRAGKGPSRIALANHLELLTAAGFTGVKSSLELGPYGCMFGFAP